MTCRTRKSFPGVVNNRAEKSADTAKCALFLRFTGLYVNFKSLQIPKACKFQELVNPEGM